MALDKEIKNKLIKEFELHPNDTGSVEVQVALLTENIQRLTNHLKANHNDFSSKRGLLIQVSRRQFFLKYLAKHNPERYKLLVDRFGIKDKN
jgi:small subunit ribosomal protein S15